MLVINYYTTAFSLDRSKRHLSHFSKLHEEPEVRKGKIERDRKIKMCLCALIGITEHFGVQSDNVLHSMYVYNNFRNPSPQCVMAGSYSSVHRWSSRQNVVPDSLGRLQVQRKNLTQNYPNKKWGRLINGRIETTYKLIFYLYPF